MRMMGIEVGEITSDGLQLWRAREARRQGELRIAAQDRTLAAIEARAQALVGWTTAGVTALAGVAAASSLGAEVQAAAFAACLPLVFANFLALRVLRPREGWGTVGDPTYVLDQDAQDELQLTNGTARGLANSVARNSRRLHASGTRLAWAIRLFVLTPLAAAAGWTAGVVGLVTAAGAWVEAWLS